MDYSGWIGSAATIGILLFVWRDLHRRIDELVKRFDRFEERFDRHLEGHP